MSNKEELEGKLRFLFIQSMEGNQESYKTFLELCSAFIKRYLLHLGGKYAGQENIEDLLQEVLITLHQKKHTYQLDRPILPWLYAIARHRYIDFYRAKKRLPGTVSFDADFEKHFAETEKHEPTHNIEEVMELLTPKQKEMIFLVKVEGLSYVEAAKTLSMSVPSVKVGVHRIVKALKSKVGHEE